jgi:hypothetical protein
MRAMIARTRIARTAPLPIVSACLLGAVILLAAMPREAAGRDSARIVPLLDSGEGKRAVAAYRDYLGRLCKSLRGPRGEVAGELEQAGLDRDAVADGLCGPTAAAPKPLASGALLSSAVEVLLEVPSGLDHAAGPVTLALMRRTGQGYGFVTHLGRGDVFKALARVSVRGRPDVLVLCLTSGGMGLYPGRCGFLGRGSFTMPPNRDEPAPGSEDEFEVVEVTACGSGGSVTPGRIAVRHGRLAIELVVRKFLLEPAGPDENPNGPNCSRRKVTSRKSFTLEYQMDPAGIRRMTPVQREVQDVLDRH